jgi:hypothetical protein
MKGFLVFVGLLISCYMGWSVILYLVPTVLGATQQEAGDLERSLALPMALVTAGVLTYRWSKRCGSVPLKPPRL